jgi:atypical dual specificity phosphatase
MSGQHANEVIPRLWIGDKFAASDPEFLAKNGITVVFNATKDLPFVESVPYKYRVPVDDNLTKFEIDNMRKFAPETVYKLMRHYNSGHNILVHCHAGRQRSAAIVAMSLITLGRKSAAEAMEFLREKRAVAFFPAANFQDAIFGFEHDLRTALTQAK